VPGAGAACDGPACPKTPQRARDRLVQGGAFRHGVASGHPTERAVTLWSRVDGIERSGRLELEIARDPGFGDVVHTQRVRAAEVRDYVVRARVGEGLRPGEQYFYRFATRGADSPVGRFVTARPRDPVRGGPPLMPASRSMYERTASTASPTSVTAKSSSRAIAS
jgi:phosphodiesterase/alkaline phosphatase D-like protein